MTTTLHLATDRLLLRPWQPRDLAPFQAINSDPIVMRYFHAPFTEQETADAMDRYNVHLDRHGFTMFAAEDRVSGELLGVIGAHTMRFAVPGLAQPAVEIGWRLAAHAHGKGLATEGAQAVLDHLRTFGTIGEVVAITVPLNQPSRRVMEKLSMHHVPELTFDHPMVPEGSIARRHVLYRREL
jgi:RimJ/RimL family protein N-acetyltransferase